MNESADLRAQLATLAAQRAAAEAAATTSGARRWGRPAACCWTTPRCPSKKAAAPCPGKAELARAARLSVAVLQC